jgi:hypothetical protein
MKKKKLAAAAAGFFRAMLCKSGLCGYVSRETSAFLINPLHCVIAVGIIENVI